MKSKKEIAEASIELKKSQKIPDSTLEKIIQKLKSHIIYNMAILYDKAHEYDPNEFQKKNDNNLLNDNDSTQISNNSSIVNSEEREGRIQKFNNIKKNFSDINKDPKQIAEDLIKIELSVIKSFSVSNEDYFHSLQIALQTNKNIQNDLNFLSKYKNHFENNKLMPLNFGKVIKENFLKIVSNIYYLNLREVARQLKFNYFDANIKFNNENECTKVIFHLYEKNLKKIR